MRGSVLEKVIAIRPTEFPLVLTSRGIECESGLLMCEVATSILGSRYKIATLVGHGLDNGLALYRFCVYATFH